MSSTVAQSAVRRAPLRRLLQLIATIPPADRRQAVMLAVVLASSLTLRLVTWNALADGSWSRYVKITLVGVASAAAVWVLMRVQSRSLLPLVAATTVVLVGDSVHYVRLANPITRGAPVVAFDASFADEATIRRQWSFESNASGQVTVEPGAVVMESRPGGTAYVVARTGPIPDVRLDWWLPVGLAEYERSEQLAWRATIQRTGDFFVIADMRDLLMQAVGYGLHITYPDERNVKKGYEIQHPATLDGQPHTWELTRTRRRIALAIDGKQVWAADQRGEIGMLKLGETRIDPLHGGRMRLEAASYTSRLTRD